MFPIRRVLVVDDDEMMRDLLGALLPMDGYEVSSATEGDEAVRTLRQDPTVDVVLTDLHMPGLEGKNLVGALRSAMPEEALLIGMSGSQPAPTLRGTLDAFLVKPFDSEHLRQAIQTAREARVSDKGRAPVSTHPGTAAPSQEDPNVGPLNGTIFEYLTRVIPVSQLGELYELTLNDIAKRLERIRLAASSGDLAQAQREAHAIKGSCGMVGAAELQSLAAAIEDGTTVNTSAIAQIPSACLRLRRMLDAKLHPA